MIDDGGCIPLNPHACKLFNVGPGYAEFWKVEPLYREERRTVYESIIPSRRNWISGRDLNYYCQLTTSPFRASARVGQPVKVDYFRISLLRRSKIPPPGNSPTPTDGRRHRSRVHKPPFPHDGMVFVERPSRPRCFCATTWSLGGEDRSAKSPVRERTLAAPLLLPVAGII